MLTGIAFLALLQTKAQPRLAPAVFADASTRRIVNFSKQAYSKLRSAKFTIEADGEKKAYIYATGKIFGLQKGAQWCWNQRKLRLLCNKGIYQGVMGPYNVNAWLSSAGAQPELVPIQLAAGKNPIDVLIAPGSRVRRSGTMVLKGSAVDIIEVKSELLRVTMAIRQDNRLIADLRSVNVDKNGEVLFNSTRTFSWSLVNKPISNGAFAVAPGKSAKPIKLIK
jgi:hypothetical protein